MKNKITRFIYQLFIIIFVVACGSGSESKPKDFIPPYVDPNGGPVLKFEIGIDSTKSNKGDDFFKKNVTGVSVYDLSNNLLGKAGQISETKWQFQLPNSNPAIAFAEVKNAKEGVLNIALVLAEPTGKTYEINENSNLKYNLLLADYFINGKTLSSSTLKNDILQIEQILTQLKDQTYFNELLKNVNSTSTDQEAVDHAAAYVKYFLSMFSIFKETKKLVEDLEKGNLKVNLTPFIVSSFSSNGALDIALKTNDLTAEELIPFLTNISNSIIFINLSDNLFNVSSVNDPSITQTVSTSLTSSDITSIITDLTPPNNPPSFTSSAPTSVKEGTKYTYTIQTTDPDNDALTITANAIPFWLTLSGNVLSGTPSSGDIGTHAVVLHLTDGKISTPKKQTFNITVTASGDNSNNAPEITSTAPTTASTDKTYTYTLIATDADGDKITFAATTKPSWLSFNTTTGLLSGTPTKINIGNHNVTLTASDGISIATDTFTIIVSDTITNNAPVINTIADSTVHEGSLYSVTVTATDADSDTITLTGKTIPSWLTFSATSGVLSGTPKSSNAGSHTVKISASDGVDTSELSFKITVNTIPTITSTAIDTATVGTSYSYQVVAKDADGDIPKISLLSGPSFLTFDATSNILSGLPAEANIGVHTVKLSATDQKAVSTGSQEFELKVLSSLFKASVDGTEVTDGQSVLFGENKLTLSIGPRDTSNTSLTFKIIADGSEQTLTNNAVEFTPSKTSHTIIFKAINTSQVEKLITITLKEDTDHIVDITITGGTKLNDSYRKIEGNITFSSKFKGNTSETILSKTFQLDGVPQSLNASDEYILDPTSLNAGSYKIKATISYTASDNTTQTSETTMDFVLVANNLPTQIIKVDDLVITSDTSITLHQGTTAKVTTSNHEDADQDAITKGLTIDGVLNKDLTSYTVNISAGTTQVIQTSLSDPYGSATPITLTFTSSTTNGGIPVTLSATGTVLSGTTTYRDKVNGSANIVTIKANLGQDPENDGLGSIEWLVNSVTKTGETGTSLLLDVSSYGGTTVAVQARVTDNFTSSPTTSTASINLVIDQDSVPSFTSATLDGVSISLSSNISVDHSSTTNKTYVPSATDPEGDSFSFRYTLSGNTSSGSSFSVPYSTLNNSSLVVNIIQFDKAVATNSHNVTANNVVPTPILIGNTSHTDLNGNYSLIVRPGQDIEGDKLTTTVTLNGSTIGGVVVNNEIHYTVSLTSLGGTTAVFSATNSDGTATPITSTLNVTVIKALAPASLTATRGNASVILSWGSVNTASNYNIYYGTVQPITTSSTKISSVTSPYTITGLTNGTTYYFRVSANHTSGEGTISSSDIPMTPHAPGDTLNIPINGEVFSFRYIPAGSYTRGSASTQTGHETDEAPTHTVTISNGFWMLSREVTQNQWGAIVTNAHATLSGSPSVYVGASRPVENITWEEVNGTNGFISTMHTADPGTALTSGLYKLPTEAQWEYACRAGTTTRFHWGDDTTLASISTYAWYTSNATATNNVAQKTANAWGLYDMSGNVSEWCLDKAPSAYTSSATTDPQGPDSGADRIFRGGSWFDSANNVRSANRFSTSKDIKGSNLGFRVIRIPLATE